MTDHDPLADAITGMHTAIEYARVQYHVMSGAVDVADAQYVLEVIRDECAQLNLDLTGSLAAITLRAATLACQASTAAGHPMAIEDFLDAIEREFTPPRSA